MTERYEYRAAPLGGAAVSSDEGAQRLSVRWDGPEEGGVWGDGEGRGRAWARAETAILGEALERLRVCREVVGRGRGILEFGRRQGKKYRVAVSKLERFLRARGREDMPLYEFTGEVARDFNRWMETEGLLASTRAYYNRMLNALYNLAVGEGTALPGRPFAGLPTHHVDTPLRRQPGDLTREDVARLEAADLGDSPSLAETRDLLMEVYRRNKGLRTLLKERGCTDMAAAAARHKYNQQVIAKRLGLEGRLSITSLRRIRRLETS